MSEKGVVRGVHRSAAEWSALVSAFESFDGTMEEFCRRSGISRWSLRHWRRRLRDEPAFVEIAPPAPPPSPPCWDVELDLGDGMVLRVRRR